MIKLYTDDEIVNEIETKTGSAVLDMDEGSQTLPALRAMLRQAGIGEYVKLSSAIVENGLKVTIKINKEV